MALVWMLTGQHKQRFLVVDDKEAEALIASGDAQPATGNAESMRNATYQTRVMKPADERTPATKPKAKRKRKQKAKTKVVEPSTDAD